MSSVNYENQILDAIDTLVTNAIEKAGYDKTIQAVIISLDDAAIGKYKVKYQDSEIEAYSNNVDMVYPDGTLVYILIPNGDFSQTKTIIGAVDNENIERTTVLEEKEQYTIEGGNAIAATQDFGLCSYHENEIKVLYNKDTGINDINFDILTFEENIKKCDTMLCAAKFKTEFDNIQKKSGDFGVVYELNFKDNISGNIITQSITLNVDMMRGMPYDQTEFNRQYAFFTINGENFDSVKRIYIYCKDFQLIDEDKNINDIFVKDFELAAARKLTIDELNGYSVMLSKDGKSYFNKNDEDAAIVTIQAEVRLKNNTFTPSLVDFYWFKQNSDITISSPRYLNYGGNGWENVNKYNAMDNDERMLLTSDNTFVITKAECQNLKTNIKCVIVKDNDVVAEKIITIYNYDPKHVLTITSTQGTQFYFDNGNPDLICLVDGESSPYDYEYQWSTIDANNNVSILEETTNINEIYNAAVNELTILEAQISTGAVMAAANAERIAELQEIIENNTINSETNEYIQRVEKNKIFNVDLTKVVNHTTFRCMVKDDDGIVGSVEIELNNDLNLEEKYQLNILNGTQIFNYDYNGVAPTSKSLENPIKLLPLSFEIVDSKGNKFNDLILSTCDIQWEVPTEDTMLVGNSATAKSLVYGIAETYDNRKLNNNTIKLTVKYKNLVLNAETAFTFAKDGEPGTNGTGVICKIVTNTNNEIEDYPMIIDGTPNFTPAIADKWFKVQLWENGKKIYEGINGDSDHVVTWSLLKNTYQRTNGNDVLDAANIGITANGTCSWVGYNEDAASIVKVEVEYKDTTYYCTMPVIIAHKSDNDFTAKLIKNTGFRYVMYASDGKRPQYDSSTPFTIQVIQKINGYNEDISDIPNDYKPNYQWYVRGKIFSPDINAFVEDHHLTIKNDSNLPGNQKIFVPSEDYDGENVTNAIEVKILSNSIEKFKLLIPIHFYLDKYGISTLEGWDGNRISLDHDKGSILAPQVGAGKMNNNKQFTGVLMGEVKERGKSESEQGLFGYHEGARTIFLDAETGKAEFGKNGRGKIILDPTTNKAQLYSGNYSIANKAGMLIDLSEPEIRFGSGKFIVDKNGELTAKGGGHIGGWLIGDTKLTGGNITLNAEGSMTGGTGDSTWSISTSGKATFNDAVIKGNVEAYSGRIGNWYINSGAIKYNNQNNFYLNYDGSVKFGNFTVDKNGNVTTTGIITANSGSKIGPWNVTNTAIYNNKDSLTANKTGVYIGTDGISLGTGSTFKVTSAGAITSTSGSIGGWDIGSYKLSSTNSEGKVIGMSSAPSVGNPVFFAGGPDPYSTSGWTSQVPFYVTNQGYLKATNASITGTLSAGAGSTIGPWTVTASAIYNNKESLTDANHNGVYIGTDGISLGTGSTFKVTNAGALTATSGDIAGWTLGANAFYTTNNALYLGNSGITATIGGTSRNGIVFKAGDNFGVTSGGTVYAKNTVLTNADVSGKITADSGSVGGWTIGSTKLSGSGTIDGGTITGSAISGGTINISKNGGYLRMGAGSNWTKHPLVSGLNCEGGIAMNGHGISNVSSLSVKSGNDTFTGQSEVMYLAGSISFSFQNHTFTWYSKDLTFVNGVFCGYTNASHTVYWAPGTFSTSPIN